MESVFTPYEGVVSGEVSLLPGTQIVCDVNIGRGANHSTFAFCGFQILTTEASFQALGKQGDHPLWANFHAYRVHGRKIARIGFGANLDADQIRWFVKRSKVFIRPYRICGLEVGLNLELRGIGRKKVFLFASDQLNVIELLPSVFGIEGHSLRSYQEVIKKLRQ